MEDQIYSDEHISKLFKQLIPTQKKDINNKLSENKLEENFVTIVSYYEYVLKEMLKNIKMETVELEESKKTITLIIEKMESLKSLMGKLYDGKTYFEAYLYYILGLAKKNETAFNVYQLALSKELDSDKALVEVISCDEQKILGEMVENANADFKKSCEIAKELLQKKEHPWAMQLVLIEAYRARDKLEILHRYFVCRQKEYSFESSEKHIIYSMEYLSKLAPACLDKDADEAFCATVDDRLDYLKELFELYKENSLPELEKLFRRIRNIAQLSPKICSYIDENFFNNPLHDVIKKSKMLIEENGFISGKTSQKFTGNKSGFLKKALALFEKIDNRLKELSKQCQRPDVETGKLLCLSMKEALEALKNVEIMLDCCSTTDPEKKDIKKRTYKILYMLQAVLCRISAEFNQKNIEAGIAPKSEKNKRNAFCEKAEDYLMQVIKLQRDHQNEVDRLMNVSEVWLEMYMVRHLQININNEYEKRAIEAALECVQNYSSALDVLEQKLKKEKGFSLDDAKKMEFLYPDLLEKRFSMIFKLEEKCALPKIGGIIEILRGLWDKTKVFQNMSMSGCLTENLKELDERMGQKTKDKKKRQKNKKKETEKQEERALVSSEISKSNGYNLNESSSVWGYGPGEQEEILAQVDEDFRVSEEKKHMSAEDDEARRWEGEYRGKSSPLISQSIFSQKKNNETKSHDKNDWGLY